MNVTFKHLVMCEYMYIYIIICLYVVVATIVIIRFFFIKKKVVSLKTTILK